MENGFRRVGADVYCAQVDLDRWHMRVAVEHHQSGERKALTVATITETREDQEYRISYPVPKRPNNRKGFRAYTHRGDLASAVERVRKAANR